MEYRVFILEKRFYKWEIKAGSKEEAKFLAKKFFSLSSERDENFIGSKLMIWAQLEKF